LGIEGLACGADRVQGIGFAAAAAAAPGPAGLKDMLASSSQGTGQPGAVRSAALYCPPDPPARAVPGGEPGQLRIARGVCADLDRGQMRAKPVHDGGGVGAGMGASADDGVGQVCEHGHGPFSCRARAVRPIRHRPGAHTRRHICDGSRTRGTGRGQASDQASKVSQAGAGALRRHVLSKARHHGGQII